MFDQITDARSLSDALEQRGISKQTAQNLAGLGQFGVALLPTEVAPDRPPGVTKLGGLPDLPADLHWPSRPAYPKVEKPKGFWTRLTAWLPEREVLKKQRQYCETSQPLNFLAQINLSEIAASAGEEYDLPASGMVYFFYDDLEQGWGFDPSDAIGFRVLYSADMTELKQARRPSMFEEVRFYKEVALAGERRFEPCEFEGIHAEGLMLSQADREAYDDFFEHWNDWRIERSANEMGGDPAAHKLRGVPNLVQGPMEEQCALVSQGISFGDGTAYDSPAGRAVLAQPNDWVLLLQLGSDAQAGMQWGDMGKLFFWIKKSDLQQCRFDRGWLILQCY
ncbi:YwqG family protein [Pseudophaeobacter sp.]|uniref:YwqG family protein n=1 Tax=Pseudophaeobacter sp. TaxID=1971739 RepID=UPI003296D597